MLFKGLSAFILVFCWTWQGFAQILPFGVWRVQNHLDPSWTPQWSGLKAYWKMNGTAGAIGSGETLVDYFGTSNGTSAGTGLSYAAAKMGPGVTFNGAQYFTVPQSAPANVCTAMTVMLWVKWNAPSSPSYGHLLNNWDQCNTGVAAWTIVQTSNTKKVEFNVNTSGGGNQARATTGTPLDGTWRHIAVTVTAGGSGVWYIDGVQDSTFSISMGSGFCSPSQPMKIGNGGSCGSAMGNGGMMDEIAIWNTVLTSTEVSKIYNRQKNGPY